MGRKKGTSTRRKQILQLDDGNKVDSSRAASNFDYAQMTSSSAGISKAESQNDEAAKSATDQPTGGGGAMETKLAGFLKEIYELGTSEQQGEVHVDNGQGSTPEQIAMETSNGETDNGKASLEGKASQQQRASQIPPSPAEESQLVVTFWQEVMDPNTNHVYYWNPETNEVTWTLPANGVITNEVPGDGTGTGPDGGTGTENSTGGGSESNQKSGESASSSGPKQETVKKSSAAKKVAKKAEIDIFESTKEESSSKLPASQPAMEGDSAQATVDTQERSLSKKRKASPQPSDSGLDKEALDAMLEQSIKKPRLAAAAPNSGSSGGIAEGEGVSGESETNAPPVSKQAEQMLRFQVSNFADEFSRKLQYLHVSSEGLSDLQILQVQLQTRLTDWKEGGLSSKYMLSKLKQFNTDLERYERSSAPEGWKFVWDSSTCRYKFYNLSTGESSWSYPMLGEQSPVASQDKVVPVKTSQEKIVPEKKEVPKERETEERGSQDDAMETESEVGNKQQQQQPVGPVRPVPPPISAPPPPEVSETTASQVSQQKPKPVKPEQPAPSKVATPTSTQQNTAVAAPGKVKSQKSQQSSGYEPPTAEYFRAPDGPVVLPVSRFQKRMEEKQAELENPVEGWNLSVKDVRKILSRKHRHRRSASNDDVIREGDYPMDDDDNEEEEVGGAKEPAKTGEDRPSKEPIAEFPISSSRRTRSSTSSHHSRRPPEHHHHHREHQTHREHQHRSSTLATVSPVISISPVMLAAAAASVDPPAPQATPPTGMKAPPTTGSLPPTAQKQPPPPIPQPSALPPPHLKTPVSMVISRDPRVAKRQQQLLEKAQSTPPTQQQPEVNTSSKTGADSKSPSPATEISPQKSSETDEARIRERLLLRQKYRIRKVSDRRDSKDDSPEQSPTATTPPAAPAPAPIKSCLVKGPCASTSQTSSNVNIPEPPQAAAMEVEQSNAQSSGHEQVIAAMPTAASSEQGANLRPPRQLGFGGSMAEESVEQSTGELELSPHKKAVFVLDANAAPVDVTSLPVHKTSTTHEVLSDSRVEPETGEVESTNISSSSQVPSQIPLGTGSSASQAEATPTTEAQSSQEQAKDENETQTESDDEKDDSSDSSDEEDNEGAGGVKHGGGIPIGKCYMDHEGVEPEEEMDVASDKEAKEEDSDQSDQDRYGSSKRRKKRRSSRSRSRSRSYESRRRSGRKRHVTSGDERSSRSRRYDNDRSDYSDENSEDHRSSSRHHSSRRSSKYSRKYESSSSRSSRRSSRKHRRSRSRSRGSHDSRERDYGGSGRSRDRDRDRPSFSGSSKHKKKDKKEKKKRRHKSSPRGGSGSGDEKNKQQFNVLVGKVGKVGSVRTLGQDKKPSESEEGEAQLSTAANEATNQMTAAVGGDNNNLNQQSQLQQQYQQQYNMSYYQQHPSTGQMPYYGTTTATAGTTYPDYMYGYSQDPYNQQAAWQTWQQQQQGSGGQGAGGQQTWGASSTSGGGQQYVAYPIAGMGGSGAPPPPPPTTTEAPPTVTDAADSGNVQAQQDSSAQKQQAVSPPREGEIPQPRPPASPSPPRDEQQDDSTQPHPPPDQAPPNSTTEQPLPIINTAPVPAPPPAVDREPIQPALPPEVVTMTALAVKDGTDTPPMSTLQTHKQVAMETTTAVVEEREEDGGREEEGGEEIMECEMEIEDDSLDASGTEEATPPMEPTISVAPPIPVVADLCVDDKGQKVNQALPPTPQEEGSSKVEEDEPLPPGVEEEAEPLPPGIDIDSATSSKDMGKASSVSQEPGRGGQSLAASMAQTAASSDTTAETTNTASEGAGMVTQQEGQSTAVAPSSAEVTTTIASSLQGDDGTATPPMAAQSATYSAYSGATSQGAATSYVTAASYANQPGAAQYSYAYGQGYGNYAAYGAYAAYGGYPGQYYQAAAYGSYPYAAAGYYGAATGAYTAPYQQQPTSQATTSTPTSTANKEKPPPKIMMEQWNAFQEAATKKP